MKRQCAICGKELDIKVNEDKTYSGGCFFGKIVKGKEYWEGECCWEIN